MKKYIENFKMNTKLSYDDIKEILNSGYCGTDGYYKTTFNPNFFVTSCVHTLFEKCKTYWLGDLVNSYIPKVYKEIIDFDDNFFLVNLKVHEDQGEGIFKIQREIYNEKTEDENYYSVVEQNIPFIDLPAGGYKFYLIGEPWEEAYMFIMLAPSEY